MLFAIFRSNSRENSNQIMKKLFMLLFCFQFVSFKASLAISLQQLKSVCNGTITSGLLSLREHVTIKV